MKRTLSVAFAFAVMIACTTNGPEGPTTPPTSNTPAVEATPAPAPTAKPVTTPTTDSGFDLACLSDSTLTVKNNGGVVAVIETSYTTFDNQNLPFGLLRHTVQPGDTVTRKFDVCQQGDADLPGSKLIGGCFWDKKGQPFIPSRNPEKVTECRTCVPTYTTRVVTTWRGEGCKRLRIETTYTLSSCTQRETSEEKEFNDPSPVYRTDSWFQVDNLSNGGSNYRIYDDKLAFPWIWRDNLTLAAGNQQTKFPHAANGAKLTLYWWPFLGIGAEKIGEAKAECAEIEDNWHGRVSFQCKRIDTCVQPQ